MPFDEIYHFLSLLKRSKQETFYGDLYTFSNITKFKKVNKHLKLMEMTTVTTSLFFFEMFVVRAAKNAVLLSHVDH